MAERSSVDNRSLHANPHLVLDGMSQYGLGFKLVSDALFIQEKGLAAKQNFKIPFHESVGEDFRQGVYQLVDNLRGTTDHYAQDSQMLGLARREAHMGHINTAVRYAEVVRDPYRRFKALLNTGSSFTLPNPQAEDALARARNTVDQVVKIDEKARALAWSAWIDKQVGNNESKAFDGADIAFKRLVSLAQERAAARKDELSTGDVLEDASNVGCEIARVAAKVDRDPEYYLTVSKLTASRIPSWGKFVDSYTQIIQTEKELGLDHKTSLTRLKERITPRDDEPIHDSNISTWLRIVDLEKNLGEDWQGSLDQVRDLCKKLDYPKAVAEGYGRLGGFEADNNIDPTPSLKKAKAGARKLKWFEKKRANSLINGVEEGWKRRSTNSEDKAKPESPPTPQQTQEMLDGLSKAADEALVEISKIRNGDQRVATYLEFASELAELNIDPMDVIDLAKAEVYKTSHRPSFEHRLRALGRYQFSIGMLLHKRAFGIIAHATSEELNQAFQLAKEEGDPYSLVGFGAYVPAERHEAILQTMDESQQANLRRYFAYGASISQ